MTASSEEDRYAKLKQLIEENIARHERENPVKPGFVRVYEDHTYRNYQDVPEKWDYDPENPQHVFIKILQEEIQKEINREINREIVEKIKNNDDI